ncbi:unnamed protein product [Miscanthus lutarioriparius]|uniref:Uncharacterized protein n=1 Tax=Miscanthus lutarioriparius TaxID=422564 RepID=A0A811QYC8_9POAL|nr:unnamed protein product [Miscanthus lutarioriparius]
MIRASNGQIREREWWICGGGLLLGGYVSGPTLPAAATAVLANTEGANILRRNSDDVGWEYGVLVDANKGKVKCKLCDKVHTKKRNRLTTVRLNKLVYIQFNSKLINKKEKIKSKKISDVLLSNDTTEAQGFLHENGDDCALVVYRDEEDEMEGTGIPWSVIGDAVGAEEQLELRRSARVGQLYEGEEFDSEEQFDEDEDDYVEPY